MTPDEKLAMHAAILANPEANALLQAGNYNGLRTLLNAPSNPEFWVWKTAVDPLEIMQNGMDWTRVDNLSVGKARIWDWMTKLPTFNPSKANIRAGIDATWVGTTADLAVRANVYTHCKRVATGAERLMATGTGTNEVPGLATFEGELSDYDAVMLVLKDDGTIWST